MWRVKIIPVLLTVILFSCGKDDYQPKPKGFNRIDLPPHEYQQLESGHPFTFEYSEHAQEKEHKSWISEPHWLDIYYPDFDANIELTYKPLNDTIKLPDLIDDVHQLAFGHDKKAYAIDQNLTRTDQGLVGFMFELEGEVPSQFQFAVTDSTENFVRAALYFKTALKNDSLQPVINYVKRDMIHMMNTLKFKE